MSGLALYLSSRKETRPQQQPDQTQAHQKGQERSTGARPKQRTTTTTTTHVRPHGKAVCNRQREERNLSREIKEILRLPDLTPLQNYDDPRLLEETVDALLLSDNIQPIEIEKPRCPLRGSRLYKELYPHFERRFFPVLYDIVVMTLKLRGEIDPADPEDVRKGNVRQMCETSFLLYHDALFTAMGQRRREMLLKQVVKVGPPESKHSQYEFILWCLKNEAYCLHALKLRVLSEIEKGQTHKQSQQQQHASDQAVASSRNKSRENPQPPPPIDMKEYERDLATIWFRQVYQQHELKILDRSICDHPLVQDLDYFKDGEEGYLDRARNYTGHRRDIPRAKPRSIIEERPKAEEDFVDVYERVPSDSEVYEITLALFSEIEELAKSRYGRYKELRTLLGRPPSPSGEKIVSSDLYYVTARYIYLCRLAKQIAFVEPDSELPHFVAKLLKF